jgi:hypothetical protein
VVRLCPKMIIEGGGGPPASRPSPSPEQASVHTVAALRVWQLGDVTGGQHLGVGDPQLGKWRMVRRDVGRLAFLRVGLHLRCTFPCYAAEHAIIHLDRYLYRLYDRRANSRNLGWRYALLFGSVAQCRRCLCGVVARVSSVNMIATRLNQLLKNEKNLRHESAPSPLLVRMHPPGDRWPHNASDLDLLWALRLSVIWADLQVAGI